MRTLLNIPSQLTFQSAIVMMTVTIRIWVWGKVLPTNQPVSREKELS
jgi:hypothetical protein